MSTKLLRNVRLIVLVMALAVLAMAAGSASPASAGKNGCKKVNGQVEMVQVFGDPDCKSPLLVPLCAQGTVKGDLKGTVYLTVTSVVPDPFDPNSPPSAFSYMLGDAKFELKDGTLETTDAMVVANTDAKEFAEVITITGGGDKYGGATGTLTATGATDPKDRDTAVGDYSGQICFN
jgi:hypothetical protein